VESGPKDSVKSVSLLAAVCCLKRFVSCKFSAWSERVLDDHDLNESYETAFGK